MRTFEEIAENYMIIERGNKKFAFAKNTPTSLCDKILDIYERKTRIVIDYGDINSGNSWNETYDTTGYIGMSLGLYDIRYPILVHNKRSLGGGTILTNCILSIKTSLNKITLYQHQLK